jgi:predicted membrane channel-forming protein YqfA (hemolysin III family)
MANANRLVGIINYALMGIGALILFLSIFFARVINLALPLVFLKVGGVFYLLAPALQRKWS